MFDLRCGASGLSAALPPSPGSRCRRAGSPPLRRLLIGAITHAQGNPDLRPITRLAKPYISAIEAGLQHLLAAGRDPDAGVFYKRLVHGGFAPNDLIDVLPQQRIIYVCVPKNASTRIKLTLSLLLGRNMRSESDVHRRKLSGLKSPKRTGLVAFHRIATDPLALRFAFVRNPYERLVSCWLDKFRGVPLTEGRPSVALLSRLARAERPLAAVRSCRKLVLRCIRPRRNGHSGSARRRALASAGRSARHARNPARSDWTNREFRT